MLPVLVGELAFALWLTAGKHRLAATAAGPMSAPPPPGPSR
jgi:hypothetical protein